MPTIISLIVFLFEQKKFNLFVLEKSSGISQIEIRMNDTAINLGRFEPMLFMTAPTFNSFTPSY